MGRAEDHRETLEGLRQFQEWVELGLYDEHGYSTADWRDVLRKADAGAPLSAYAQDVLSGRVQSPTFPGR